LFDDTLEPMLNVALEGASFINAYNRGTARQLASKLPNATGKLDENAARLVAVNEGVPVVLTGSLSNRGGGYTVSVKALDPVTGKTLTSANVNAANMNGPCSFPQSRCSDSQAFGRYRIRSARARGALEPSLPRR
jgi:hypothetical protein